MYNFISWDGEVLYNVFIEFDKSKDKVVCVFYTVGQHQSTFSEFNGGEGGKVLDECGTASTDESSRIVGRLVFFEI